MDKKRGRPPKNDTKTDQYRLRLNDEERTMLEHLAEESGVSMSEILIRGLRMQYNLAKFSD
ncbi:plasmid mobilization protein [Cuneatibacter caecimuris]|uniref:plasmid mobilization protein n=1 Tax=Cuneatibacter caecimuris TaxID=1796618 RepID=UPI00102BC798|nr:hypothetical protein [Cuneatibacter caecimuris]